MYRIAICDDDKMICEQVQKMLERCPGVPDLSILTYYDGEELCSAVRDGMLFDLFILDIEMQGLDGVKTGRLLREKLNDGEIQLLYISGNTSHAMELFDLRPLNFLSKPINEKKVDDCLRLAVALTQSANRRFEFRYKKILYRVEYRHICYFESRNKIVIIHTVRGDMTMLGQLSEIMQQDDIPITFFQIHQSFIVNYDYVKKVGSQQLTMEDGTDLAISYSFRKQVQDRIRILAEQQRG